jgi:hypothetical protein
MKFLPSVLMCALLVNVPAVEAATTPTVSLTSNYKNTAASLATGLSISLPVLAFGITVAKGDGTGAGELLTGTILSVGTAYGLKSLIHEERPDDGSNHSIPAVTSALAGSGSTFLWARYGWQYGLPAWAASDMASFSLTQAKKARWYDALAGSMISTGYGIVVTRRFKSRYNLNTRLSALPGGAFVSFSYEF